MHNNQGMYLDAPPGSQASPGLLAESSPQPGDSPDFVLVTTPALWQALLPEASLHLGRISADDADDGSLSVACMRREPPLNYINLEALDDSQIATRNAQGGPDDEWDFAPLRLQGKPVPPQRNASERQYSMLKTTFARLFPEHNFE